MPVNVAVHSLHFIKKCDFQIPQKFQIKIVNKTQRKINSNLI